jgi:hypothetical protein
METLVTERNGRIFLTQQARVVHASDEVSEDYAAAVDDWEVGKSSPFVKWISGSYVESDNPNSNKQYWTSADLAFGEYSIKYAPLNMLHKVTRPVGFYLATKKSFYNENQAEAAKAPEKSGPFKIEALSGMWSHIFPFESALVDQANEKGMLFYSMECRSKEIACAGAAGCGKTFGYGDVASHCIHIKERSSIRHLVQPTFRGGALIIPPIQPGWQDANAQVAIAAVADEARKYAEQTEGVYNSARASGADLSPGDWEALMAAICQLS